MPVIPTKSVDDLHSYEDHNTLRSAILGEHQDTVANEHAVTINLGDGTSDSDRTINAKRLSGNRSVRWNETMSRWEFTNDGAAWQALSGTGPFEVEHFSAGGHRETINLGDPTTDGNRTITAKLLSGDKILRWNDTSGWWEIDGVQLASKPQIDAEHMAVGAHKSTINLSTGADDADRSIVAARTSGNRTLKWDETAGAWMLTNDGASLYAILTVGGGTLVGTLAFAGQSATDLVIDPRASDPGSPVVGQRWYNTTDKVPRTATDTGVVLDRQAFKVTTADSTEISNTSSETSFDEDFSVPAGTLEAGRNVVVRASGKYSTTGTPTFTFRLKLGSAELASSGAITAGTGAADDAWEVEAEFTVRVSGASGSAVGRIRGMLSTGAGAVNTGLGRAAGVSINTTLGSSLGISVEMSVADTSNKITLEQQHMLQ